MGVSIGGIDNRQAAMARVDALEKLMKETGHPMRLSEVGVTEEALAAAPFHAIADAATLFNPRPVSDPNEMAELFKQVFYIPKARPPPATEGVGGSYPGVG